MSTTADVHASNQPARIAVIGSGPAGIYASDLLVKSELDVQIDLFEKMPAPFGLIRYGVAPDHPRIKGIVQSLHNVMEKNEIRFLGNIEVGRDITVDEMHEYYDAIIFATGATQDKAMGLPGEELDGSFGSAEFVGFYDGNPNFKREWDLSAESVAVIGVGNVSLDVSRILAKTADELLVTEIPDNVYQSLKDNKAKEVHVFGRRGPAQAKYTPKELKELDESPTIEVIVAPEDIDYDAASEAARRESKSVDLVCQTLESYAMREPGDAPHKIYIHFFESPTEIVGEDGKVVGIRTERTQLDGNGNVTGTGATFLHENLLAKLVRVLYRHSMKYAYKVFFQNSGDRDYFIRHHMVRDNWDMLPGSGVNLEQHAFSPMPEGDTVGFIYIGRVMAVKGVEQFMDCARAIRREHPETRFYMAGFIEEERYKALVDEYVRDGSIEYLGFRKDIDEWIKKCCCTVLPSLGGEGVPNVMLESAASGRACIATRIPGSVDTIDDGVTGYIYTPGSTEELILRVESFLALSPDERAAMGRAGRAKMEKEFDREIVIDKYIREVEQ